MWIGFNVPDPGAASPQQLEKIDPANKELKLSLVAGRGRAGIAGLPTRCSALSPTCLRSRLRRRRPWALVGGRAARRRCVAARPGDSVPMLILGWGLVQLALNILLAALMAMIPDRVPVTQRGVHLRRGSASRRARPSSGSASCWSSSRVRGNVRRTRDGARGLVAVAAASLVTADDPRPGTRPPTSAAQAVAHAVDPARAGTPTSAGPGSPGSW